MRYWIAPLLAAVAVSPALAGGAAKAGGAHETCTMSLEECRQAMAEVKDRGWVGLDLDKVDSKLVVTEVYPTSPAARAGFLVGDVLVALNGVPLTDENQEKLATMKRTLTPGTEVIYDVARKHGTRHLTVTLGRMPQEVYDAMVAKHLAEHEGSLATN